MKQAFDDYMRQEWPGLADRTRGTIDQQRYAEIKEIFEAGWQHRKTPNMKVPQRQLTDVERLVREANVADGGYHLTLEFPDGSRLDAPIVEIGPNWASFAELRDQPLMVDTADAKISINWSPGPAEASGPRFDYLNVPAATPKI